MAYRWVSLGIPPGALTTAGKCRAASMSILDTPPPPSPRTAQYAHKELTDTTRELVQDQDGSLPHAASRLFSSGLAPASLFALDSSTHSPKLLLSKCPAATPHAFPDHAARLFREGTLAPPPH